MLSAPSGLVLGGGEEVAIQSNFVVSHTNIVMGLVETGRRSCASRWRM